MHVQVNDKTIRQGAILLVDNIPENLTTLESLYIREGFVVHTTRDPSEALAMVKGYDYDLVVLDAMIPGMGGIELCRRIKEEKNSGFFPVMLFNALNDRDSTMTAFDSGADHFITKPFDREELVAKTNALIRLKNLQDDLDPSENVVLTLAVALESLDPSTKGHSVRVGELSKMFGEHLGFTIRDQDALRQAGYLHDIGKISLSAQVLCKEEQLTSSEVQMVRRHVIVGEDICRPLDPMKNVLRAIRHHHERWDGSGFPDRLAGEEIPVMARMLSITDSFDAMVSGRPYRKKMKVEEVLRIMQDEQELGQWDPLLVDYFIDMINARSSEIYLDG